MNTKSLCHYLKDTRVKAMRLPSSKLHVRDSCKMQPMGSFCIAIFFHKDEAEAPCQ